MVEAKMMLAKILEKYEVTKSSRTVDDIELNPRALILQPKNGIWLKLKKIQS